MAVSRKRTASPADSPAPRPAARTGRDPIPVPRLVPRGKTAFDTVEWRTHDALIRNAEGKTVFEQKGIRAPTAWTETSVNIAASKYFRIIGARREGSVDGGTTITTAVVVVVVLRCGADCFQRLQGLRGPPPLG